MRWMPSVTSGSITERSTWPGIGLVCNILSGPGQDTAHFCSCKPSAFTHTRLRLDENKVILAATIDDPEDTRRTAQNKKKFGNILDVEISRSFFDKYLSAVQSTMLYFWTFLFSGKADLHAHAE